MQTHLSTTSILSKPIIQEYIQEKWYPNQIVRKRQIEWQQMLIHLETTVPYPIQQEYFFTNEFFIWIQQFYTRNKLQNSEEETTVSPTTWISCMEFLFAYCVWILLPLIDVQQDHLVARKLWKSWVQQQISSSQLFEQIRRQILDKKEEKKLFYLQQFVQKWIQKHLTAPIARQVSSVISQQQKDSSQSEDTEVKNPMERQKQQQQLLKLRLQQEMSLLFLKYFYNKYCRTKYTTRDIIQQYQQEFL